MHGQPKKEAASLVPWSHPFMRRNGLVNQIDFLGLAHFCNSVNYSVKKICQTCSKKIRRYLLVLGPCCICTCNNCQSCNLIGAYHFFPRNLPSFNGRFLVRRCTQAGHEPRRLLLSVCASSIFILGFVYKSSCVHAEKLA